MSEPIAVSDAPNTQPLTAQDALPPVPDAEDYAAGWDGIVARVPTRPAFLAGLAATTGTGLAAVCNCPAGTTGADRWHPLISGEIGLAICVALSAIRNRWRRRRTLPKRQPLPAIPLEARAAGELPQIGYRQFDAVDQRRANRPYAMPLVLLSATVPLYVFLWRDISPAHDVIGRLLVEMGVAIVVLGAVFVRLELIFAAVFSPAMLLLIGLLGADVLDESRSGVAMITLLPFVTGFSALHVQWWLTLYRKHPVTRSLAMRLQSDTEVAVASDRKHLRRLQNKEGAKQIAMCACLSLVIGWATGNHTQLALTILFLIPLSAIPTTHSLLRFIMPMDGGPPVTARTLTSEPRGDLQAMRRLYAYQTVSIEQYAYWKTRTDPIFTHIEPALPKAGMILDAGCGYGLMSNLLAMTSADRQVVGVDLHVPKITCARVAGKSLPNVRFELADLLAWPFPSCDAVLMIDITHYWMPEKQIALIEKAAAALRPGGTLIFRETFRINGRDHAGLTWFEKIGMWANVNPRGEGLLYQDGDFYRDAFRRAGLTIVEEHPEWGLANNHALVLRKPAEPAVQDLRDAEMS